MRNPIVDPLDRTRGRTARRLGVDSQRDLNRADSSTSKRAGHNRLTPLDVTIGPFYCNDLAGTATAQATLGFFNTATALSRTGTDPYMPADGEVIGAWIVGDDARTAGTATVVVRVNGATFAFADGSCVLNATNTLQNAQIVGKGRGVPFNAGDSVGASVTTSGWTPTTANIAVWVVCRLEPI